MVSVVIPHYGGVELISECLNSLNACTYAKLEIIVVDNNSPDNSVEYIKTNFANVNLIESKQNYGFAGGCNLGANKAKGDYVLILNNDTIHEPNWIELLVKKIESDKSISSVQPKIKNFNHREYFDYAGASGGYMDKYCFPFSRGRIFNTIERDKGQYNDSCKIFWASGTAFLTRKKIYDKLNGFDEILFAHMEEIDYHWKCQLMDYEIWVVPDSVIYHKGAKTLPASSPKKTYLNYRNSMILLLTNYPLKIALSLFFPRLFMEFISLIKELLLLKWSHAFSIIKSWFWILTNLSKLKNRRESFNSMNNNYSNMIYSKSIIKKYFIEGKKYFSKIK